jgi:hypothetical protein
MTIAAIMCFESTEKYEAQLFAVEHPAKLNGGRYSISVVISRISIESARIHFHTPYNFNVQDAEIDIPSTGIIRCRVTEVDVDSGMAILQFVALAGETRHRLIRAIFTDELLQRQPEEFQVRTLFFGVLRRFLRST